MMILAAVAATQASGEPGTSGRDSFPAYPLQPDLTPGYALTEGAIQIPISKTQVVSDSYTMATFGGVSYWAGGIVPYDFVATGNGAVFSDNQTDAVNAVNAISSRAAVSGDANRIRFQNSSFNNSPVGVQGGPQIINILSKRHSFVGPTSCRAK